MPKKRQHRKQAPPDAAVLKEARELAQGLYSHQIEGVAFLLGRRRAILADDMGLGKTRQSIIAIKHAEPTGPYLIVCPASVKKNWTREVAIVRPEEQSHIVGPADLPAANFDGWIIINYDILGKHLSALAEYSWRGIVFDEAHYLKNHRSQRTRHAVNFTNEVADEPPIHLLTGTPLTSRPRDLFTLLQIVRHPLGKSFLGFAKRYCDAYKSDFGWNATGASNVEELAVQLHGIMLRRTKNDVLDLPPKLRTWLEIDVDNKVAQIMSEMVLEALQRFSHHPEEMDVTANEERPKRGSRPARLMGRITTARLMLSGAKVKHTINFVENIIEQGEKVIVFFNFLEPMELMLDHFNSGEALTISGSVPADQRQVIADRFQEDKDVRILVAQIAAAGVGLNLTAARQVVFNDLDWVPTNHWQAEDRAYRIGQTGSVNVTYMVASKTIDEFVRTVLETKSHLVDQLVEGDALPEMLRTDVMGELRRMMEALEPHLSKLPDGKVDGDQVQDLLQRAGDTLEQELADDVAQAKEKQTVQYSAEVLDLLARALAGPVIEKYRVRSSSQAGAHYELDVSGSDITCSCKGFFHRGNCQHARRLKDTLVAKRPLPPDMSRVR